MFHVGCDCLHGDAGSRVFPEHAWAQKPDTDYFTSTEVTAANGRTLVKSVIAGPPTPPKGYEVRPSVNLDDVVRTATVNIISDVPAFSWSYGCSATSAAMIAGYYDRNGYPNIYTGPANDGVMPLNNDTYWPTSVDSAGDTRPNCPLSATKNGLDGRAIKGHVDDYWVSYGSSDDDPYITGSWTEHSKGDCTGDFMGTNQSASPIENTDGATRFFNFTDGSKFSSAAVTGFGITDQSGMYGVKEFYESRGYTVAEAYNQYIYGFNGNTQGFTFAQYMNEIDNGRPVMFHVQGHTMVGVGYDSSSNLMYIHDTWDHENHTMTWGGSYSGMAMYAVTIVVLEDAPTPPAPPATSSALPPYELLLD